MTRKKKKFGQKLEDRRTEYTALRAEILQSDRTCLLMMGYLFAAVGFLYANDSEWLVSLLSFVGLCYFTEKRFSIRLISKHIMTMGGFKWDRKIEESRKGGEKLRPFQPLRPYNVEAITCLFVACSPLFNGIYDNFGKLAFDLWNYFRSNHFDNRTELYPNLTDYFWLIFWILTCCYSIYSMYKYNFRQANNNENQVE